MKTYRSNGERITWTNDTGVAVSSGAVVVVGLLVCVAMTDIAAAASGALTIVGEQELAATAAEAWPQGSPLWWNTATSKLTAQQTSGLPFAGPATKAKAALATTACVKLAGGQLSAAGGALDWQESVKDSLDFTAAEPADPDVGDRYLNTGTGDSSETAQAVVANQILVWNGVNWTTVAATKGMAVMTEDDYKIFIYTTSWVELGTPANIKDLTDAGNADALHVHTMAAGITDSVEVANLAAGIQDALPTLTLTGADLAAAGTGTVTIQAKDAAGNNLAGNFLVRTWIGEADDFGHDAQTDFSVNTGTERQEIVADADYEAVTDATGKVVMAINHGGAGSVYVWAEIDGKVYASGEIVLTAP